MTGPDVRIYSLLVLGIGVGLYLFFKGFRAFRKYRLIEDTPITPIRSVPMGLVRIHGKASGEILLTSPVTRQPCCYYKVTIDKWTNRDRHHSWEHYKTEALSVRFRLEDATGSIAVEPTNAELDLLQSAKREVRSDPDGNIVANIAQPFLPSAGHAAAPAFPSEGAGGATSVATASVQSGATDKELLGFIATAGGPLSNLLASGAQERPISAGPLQVSFSHSKVPVPAPDAKLPGQAPTENSPLSAAQQEWLRQMMAAARSRKGSSGPATFSRRTTGFRLGLDSTPEDADSATDAADAGQPGSVKYLLTEYCILPGHYYDVVGTCTENPQSPNELDRNLICQGQNEPTFLISWRGPQVLNRLLGRRAARLVFGGSALSLACLSLLLARLGLF